MTNDQNLQNYYTDDEIDIFELFKTLWSYRFKIAVITLAFLALGIIYTLIATPWYKATALVEIGYYKDPKDGVTEVVLAKTPEVTQKLSVKYIDLLGEIPDKSVVAKSISEVKNNPKFFNITTLGKSNDEAVNFIKKIVADAADEHQNTLDGYISSQKIALANIDRQIEFLKNSRIVEVEQQIKNMENNEIPRLDRQIKYLEESTIPLAKKDVENIDNINLTAIEKRIELATQGIKQYSDELNKIRESISSALPENLVMLSMQEQNLNSQITAAQERLIALEQQKELLTTKTRPELQSRLDRLTNIDLVNMQADMDKLKSDTLPTLQRQLYNLQTQELAALLDKRSVVELSLQPHSYKNTSIVSDIVTSQSPEKPKKLLIWAISLVIGFMFSVFGVLVWDAISKRLRAEKA